MAKDEAKCKRVARPPSLTTLSRANLGRLRFIGRNGTALGAYSIQPR